LYSTVSKLSVVAPIAAGAFVAIGTEHNYTALPLAIVWVGDNTTSRKAPLLPEVPM
jgi:hypothetical protein